MKVLGKYYLELSKGGEILLVREGKNLVVTTGLNLIAGLINLTGNKPRYMAFGSGTAAPDMAQTALTGAEHIRIALTPANIANSFQLSGTWAWASAGVAVNEIGIFESAAAGIMLSRFLPAPFTMPNGGSLAITWQIGFV